jgi:mycofactocin precursor
MSRSSSQGLRRYPLAAATPRADTQGYAPGMENPTVTDAPMSDPLSMHAAVSDVAPSDVAPNDVALVDDELLVEEISIDGMCGVY